MSVRIIVQEAPFDIAKETRELHAGTAEIGAVCTFLGIVRDINDAADVRGLYLEHYPGMTEKQIAEIVTEAESRWDVRSATVIHRIGSLAPTDEIVFVGVASRHRGDAFDACEFIIDFLKTRATFWKKEQTTDGDRWLETRESDIETVRSWSRD